MAYFNVYTSEGKVLFDASHQCYILLNHGGVTLNAASSDVLSGACPWANVTFTADTDYAPIVMVRSDGAYVTTSGFTQHGGVYTFQILGNYQYANQTVEYFIFTVPRTISNSRRGLMAVWNKAGNKTFDSAEKYLVIAGAYYSYGTSFDDWFDKSNTRRISLKKMNFTAGKRYGAAIMLMGGWHDTVSMQAGEFSAVWRQYFYFDTPAGTVTIDAQLVTDGIDIGAKHYLYNAWNTCFMVADLSAIQV